MFDINDLIARVAPLWAREHPVMGITSRAYIGRALVGAGTSCSFKNNSSKESSRPCGRGNIPTSGDVQADPNESRPCWRGNTPIGFDNLDIDLVAPM